MTLTIDLPEDRLQALMTRAQAQGVTAEQYARQVLEHELEPAQPISEMMRDLGDMPTDIQAKYHATEPARSIIMCTDCRREIGDRGLRRHVLPGRSYQPAFSSRGRCGASEALRRWPSIRFGPRGSLPGVSYIPQARDPGEQSGQRPELPIRGGGRSARVCVCRSSCGAASRFWAGRG